MKAINGKCFAVILLGMVLAVGCDSTSAKPNAQSVEVKNSKFRFTENDSVLLRRLSDDISFQDTQTYTCQGFVVAVTLSGTRSGPKTKSLSLDSLTISDPLSENTYDYTQSLQRHFKELYRYGDKIGVKCNASTQSILIKIPDSVLIKGSNTLHQILIKDFTDATARYGLSLGPQKDTKSFDRP